MCILVVTPNTISVHNIGPFEDFFAPPIETEHILQIGHGLGSATAAVYGMPVTL